MNDAPDTRGSSGTGSALIGFALGAAVGVGIALLLAPESGQKTRQRLASTARRWSKEAEHGLENARGAAMELGADARSAVKAGQDAFLRDRTTHEGAPSA